MANYEESKKKSFSIETILSKDKSRNEKSSARILYGNTRTIQFESKSSEEAPAESSYCQKDCLPIPNTEGSNRSHHGYSQQIDTLMDCRNSTSFTHRKLSNIPTSYSPSKDISDSKLGELTGSKPKKKTRTVFSRHQIFYLESAFEMKRYLSSTERSEIASTLNLTETQVKVWFQNRRNKWKSQLNGEANLPDERFPAFSFNGQYPLSIGALSTRPPNLQLYPHPLMYF